MKRNNDSNFPKILILTALLSITILSTSIVLTAFPQHLLISNTTIINPTLKFHDNNTVTIKGNQIQYSQNDIIPLNEGRDYIKITGKQIQLGDSLFTPAIRTITSSLYQSVIFEQKIGDFPINKIAQISIDNNIINLIPVSQSTINIKTSESNFIVEFTQNSTYISIKNIMLRLNKENNKINIYIVGFKNYNSIWMKII